MVGRGPIPVSTRSAVTAFLEDELGVRWLGPGELGKVVPARKTVVIEDFKRLATGSSSVRQSKCAAKICQGQNVLVRPAPHPPLGRGKLASKSSNRKKAIPCTIACYFSDAIDNGHIVCWFVPTVCARRICR